MRVSDFAFDLNNLLFQPPVNEDGSVAPSPSLEFTKVEKIPIHLMTCIPDISHHSIISHYETKTHPEGGGFDVCFPQDLQTGEKRFENFQFLKTWTRTGSILWSFQAPTFLPEDEERLKDFKLRLQVLQAAKLSCINS